jgi:hypothetical protein
VANRKTALQLVIDARNLLEGLSPSISRQFAYGILAVLDRAAAALIENEGAPDRGALFEAWREVQSKLDRVLTLWGRSTEPAQAREIFRIFNSLQGTCARMLNNPGSISLTETLTEVRDSIERLRELLDVIQTTIE